MHMHMHILYRGTMYVRYKNNRMIQSVGTAVQKNQCHLLTVNNIA